MVIQKLNLNKREGNNPNLRDVRIMGIGHLRKNNTVTHKTLKKQILDTKQVSNASITGVGASNYVVQHLS